MWSSPLSISNFTLNCKSWHSVVTTCHCVLMLHYQQFTRAAQKICRICICIWNSFPDRNNSLCKWSFSISHMWNCHYAHSVALRNDTAVTHHLCTPESHVILFIGCGDEWADSVTGCQSFSSGHITDWRAPQGKRLLKEGVVCLSLRCLTSVCLSVCLKSLPVCCLSSLVAL